MEMFKLDVNKLFWFLRKGNNVLDFSKDRHLIIHQSLALGSMTDVQKLFKEYGRATIQEEFKKPISGLYTPAVLHLFEYILGIKLENREQYIKNIYGKTSPRHS